MKLTRPLLALLALLLTLSACYSLAEDITPPPGYEYQPPPQSAPPTDVTYYPLVPPNPTAGAAIFAEKCAPCHGEGGLGNGPEANDLPNPVIPIGDSALARQSLPGEWYRTVTEGRIDFYMPPFMSLTERQRWDVVAYAYTLSMDTESVALGRERYQAYCADCHGESGRGDGARAAAFTQSVTDFTDQALMSKRSAKDLFEGIAHAAEDVPDFASQVGEDERWALADYLRSLTFASSEELLAGDLNRSSESAPEKIAEPAPDVAGAETKPEDAADDETAASPPEGQDVPDQGSITGQVVNASGVELPSDLGVTLHGYDQFQEVITATTGIDSDGLFNFDGVEMPLGRAFIVTVDYQQNLFTSDVAVVQEGEDTFYMPVSVYESTTGTSGLVIERLHILFELVSPEILRVAELIIISNTTGRVVIAPEEGQPVLEFVLPDGAANLQFQEGTLGEQFIQMASGFGDLRSIAPGESQHQILFSFDMPYNRSLELAQPVDLPVRAVIVLAPDNGIKIKSDLLVSEGVRDVQGIPYMLYSGSDLPAGSQLSITLSGRPKSGGASLLVPGPSSSMAIGLGALGLAVLAVGGWLYRRSEQVVETRQNVDGFDAETGEEDLQSLPPVETDTESLMDAIIALDDHYQAGELPEEAYFERRSVLKEQLRKVLRP